MTARNIIINSNNYDMWFRPFFNEFVLFRKHQLSVIQLIKLQNEIYKDILVIVENDPMMVNELYNIAYNRANTQYMIISGTKC